MTPITFECIDGTNDLTALINGHQADGVTIQPLLLCFKPACYTLLRSGKLKHVHITSYLIIKAFKKFNILWFDSSQPYCFALPVLISHPMSSLHTCSYPIRQINKYLLPAV